MVYHAERLFILAWFIAKMHRSNRRKGFHINEDMKEILEEKDYLIAELRTIGIAHGDADGYIDLEIEYNQQMRRRNLKPVNFDHHRDVIRIG